MKVMAFIILALLVSSCGKLFKKSSEKRQDPKALYGASTLKIKVFYEPGAEPYTQEVEGLPISNWNLLEDNLKALFKGRKNEPVLSVPKTLSEMSAMPSQNDAKWTIDDVLSLHERMNKTSDSSIFSIYFVNGHASEDDNIIGFHISDTQVMVIFKEVIRSTQNDQLLGFVPKYVEQATVIHEMGHALGLVNNGVPMQEAHQDSAHGAHCSNPNCVMYYSNEGTEGLQRFVEQFMTTQNTVMFDDKCLKDTRSF